jgi:hypothetical protein
VTSRAASWILAVVSAAIRLVVDGVDASIPGTGSNAPTMAKAAANATTGPTGAANRAECHLTK